MNQNNSECCINCQHCVKCKTLIDGEWYWDYICVLFVDEEDGFALGLGEKPSNEWDLCECFEEKK